MHAILHHSLTAETIASQTKCGEHPSTMWVLESLIRYCVSTGCLSSQYMQLSMEAGDALMQLLESLNQGFRMPLNCKFALCVRRGLTSVSECWLLIYSFF